MKKSTSKFEILYQSKKGKKREPWFGLSSCYGLDKKQVKKDRNFFKKKYPDWRIKAIEIRTTIHTVK